MISIRIFLFSLFLINAASSIQAGTPDDYEYKEKEKEYIELALESLDKVSPLIASAPGQSTRLDLYKNHFDPNKHKNKVMNNNKVRVDNWGAILGPYKGKANYGYTVGLEKLGSDLEANKKQINTDRLDRLKNLSKRVAFGRAESNKAHGGGDQKHITAANSWKGLKDVMVRIRPDRSSNSGGIKIVSYGPAGASSSSIIQPGASWSNLGSSSLNRKNDNTNNMPSVGNNKVHDLVQNSEQNFPNLGGDKNSEFKENLSPAWGGTGNKIGLDNPTNHIVNIPSPVTPSPLNKLDPKSQNIAKGNTNPNKNKWLQNHGVEGHSGTGSNSKNSGSSISTSGSINPVNPRGVRSSSTVRPTSGPNNNRGGHQQQGGFPSRTNTGSRSNSGSIPGSKSSSNPQG